MNLKIYNKYTPQDLDHTLNEKQKTKETKETKRNQRFKSSKDVDKIRKIQRYYRIIILQNVSYEKLVIKSVHKIMLEKWILINIIYNVNIP